MLFCSKKRERELNAKINRLSRLACDSILYTMHLMSAIKEEYCWSGIVQSDNPYIGTSDRICDELKEWLEQHPEAIEQLRSALKKHNRAKSILQTRTS